MNKGRPRQFDPEEALDRAMLVFWEKGYRGTSLDDLTGVMGINRPSLYAAFGDKEALFIRAVDQYRGRYLGPPIRKLLEAGSLAAGLDEFFEDMAEVVVGAGHPPGCMIACLLSEECCESETIRSELYSSIQAADEVFARVFQAHNKELSVSVSPEQAARLLTTFLHGMSIRARAGADPIELAGTARSFAATMLAGSPKSGNAPEGASPAH